MDFVAFANHWWNLPFLVMLGLCAVFFVLQLIDLGGGHGDADADVDHDADADMDADADHDVDAESGSGGGGMTAGWHEALVFLGIGRVPFMIVWVTLFLFTGFAGLFANRVLFVRAAGAYSGWWFVPVFFAALAVGVVAVRFFSRLAARFVDVGGHGATAKHELAGKIGQVASPVLNDRHGEIRVHDDRGNELLVHGCLRAGEAPLPHGTRVLLVSYDATTQLFWAAACPEIESRSEVERS